MSLDLKVLLETARGRLAGDSDHLKALLSELVRRVETTGPGSIQDFYDQVKSMVENMHTMMSNLASTVATVAEGAGGMEQQLNEAKQTITAIAGVHNNLVDQHDVLRGQFDRLMAWCIEAGMPAPEKGTQQLLNEHRQAMMEALTLGAPLPPLASDQPDHMPASGIVIDTEATASTGSPGGLVGQDGNPIPASGETIATPEGDRGPTPPDAAAPANDSNGATGGSPAPTIPTPSTSSEASAADESKTSTSTSDGEKTTAPAPSPDSSAITADATDPSKPGSSSSAPDAAA